MSESDKKKGLSACIIAKNEEKNIKECIESLKGAADEIIVLDTGSDDMTEEIASSLGCKVFEEEWKDDFSLARNAALEKASYEFILSIDADEKLVNPLQIKELINKADKKAGGWLVQVKSIAISPSGANESYISSLLRLFRNDGRIRFQGAVHEQVVNSIKKAGYTIENTGIEILHTGYAQSFEDMKAKHLRNLKLIEKILDEDSQNTYMLNHQAKTLLALNKPEKAEPAVARALELTKSESPDRPQILNYGAVIALENDDLINAKARAAESVNINPDQAFGHYILGDIYQKEKNFAFAYDSYKKALDGSKSGGAMAAVSGDYIPPAEKIYFNMGKCLLGLNMFKEAFNDFKEGFDINPAFASNLVGLANVAYKQNEPEKALELLKSAEKIDAGNEDIKKFIAIVSKSACLSDESSNDKNIPAHDEAATINTNSGKPLLSLSMIVKNEEKDLAECLESVQGIADEIIITDTGSTDRTVEIAKSFGAKVFHFEWIEDFAAARNESLKHCTGEWILYMDADERLNPENSRQIRNMLINAKSETGAFIVTLESAHKQLSGESEMHRGGYPRIFRNYGYPNIYFRGRVHEQITPSIFALGKNIEFSEITITHLGYDRPREEMEEKIQRNYKMLIRHVKEEPLNGYAWYQLGQTLAQMKLNEEAERAIRFAIDSGSLSDSVYASASAALSQLTGNQKRFDESLRWAEESLAKAPGQVYAANLKAYSLLYLGRHLEAEAEFIRVLNALKNTKGAPRSGFDIVIPEEVVIKGLNEARKKLGKVK